MSKKRILVATDAPGPAEFIEMVIPLLKRRAAVLLVTINTPAEAPYKILKKYDPLRCDREKNAKRIYKNFDPDILAVGTSALLLGPYVNNKFIELAHFASAKIICFQDLWATHRWPMNYKMMKYWDKVLAPDKLAKKFLLEDGYSGKIVVTGNPNFDRYIKLNKEKERKWLREKFNLQENDFVMLYVGRGTPQSWEFDEMTFKFFAKAAKSIIREMPEKNIVTIVRPHPRDENPTRYKKYSGVLKILDTSEFPSTDDLLPIADVIVGMLSTNHLEACYLTIPAICIILPKAGKIMLEKISLVDFPPNLVGANIGVYRENVNELRDILKRVMADKKFVAAIQKAQAKYFPLPKTPAAKKVAEEILSADNIRKSKPSH